MVNSLSVCVITKDEGKFISACLKSVKNIATEIIVVDSGSTDNTLEIAENFNARIFNIDWRDDFAYARNIAISKCNCNWILFLDADEFLENPNKLMNGINKWRSSKIGGFLLERTDIYRNKDNGLIVHYPVGLVRLFLNNLGFKYTGAVHEQINTSIIENGYQIGIHKKSIIIHQVFLNEDTFLEKKQLKYLALIDKEIAKDNFNYWMHYQKAKTLWFLGDKQLAMNYFSKLSDDINCPLVIRCTANCNHAVLLLEEGALKEAINVVDKALELVPEQSMGMLIKGNILYQADDFKNSIKAFKKVKVSINKLSYNQIIPGDLYMKPEEKKYKIACCYLAMGKILSASFLLESALRINKLHAPSLLLLAKIYSNRQKYVKALQLVNRSMEVNPEWEQAKTFLKVLNEKTQNNYE